MSSLKLRSWTGTDLTPLGIHQISVGQTVGRPDALNPYSRPMTLHAITAVHAEDRCAVIEAVGLVRIVKYGRFRPAAANGLIWRTALYSEEEAQAHNHLLKETAKRKVIDQQLGRSLLSLDRIRYRLSTREIAARLRELANEVEKW